MTDKEKLARKHKARMREIELWNIKREYKEEERNAKGGKIEESKFYIRLMFILVLEIVVFSEFIMWRTGDLSALYALIGISATLAASLFGYFSKAKAENLKKIDGAQEYEDDDESVG